MSIELRKFQKDDFCGIISLSDDQWGATHYNLASSMVKTINNIGNNIEHCILALDGAQIVGYIYGFALPNKILIPEFLYVIPSYRKHGVGKKLVKELETSTDCTVSMIFYNKSLRDYYNKMGYKVGEDLEVAVKDIFARGQQNEI